MSAAQLTQQGRRGPRPQPLSGQLLRVFGYQGLVFVLSCHLCRVTAGSLWGTVGSLWGAVGHCGVTVGPVGVTVGSLRGAVGSL